MSEPVQMLIRPATDEDMAFVFHSWLMTYRKAPATVGIPSNVFYAQHHKLIERLIEDPATQIMIVCPSNDKELICAYMVASPVQNTNGKAMMIHFVYVKETFRLLGLAKTLAKGFGINNDTVLFCSHYTTPAKPLVEKFGIVYNPYL